MHIFTRALKYSVEGIPLINGSFRNLDHLVLNTQVWMCRCVQMCHPKGVPNAFICSPSLLKRPSVLTDTINVLYPRLWRPDHILFIIKNTDVTPYVWYIKISGLVVYHNGYTTVTGRKQTNAIWRHMSGSTLVKVMAWCLMAPCHYPNQFSLVLSEVLRHPPEYNFTGNGQDTYPWYEFENY